MSDIVVHWNSNTIIKATYTVRKNKGSQDSKDTINIRFDSAEELGFWAQVNITEAGYIALTMDNRLINIKAIGRLVENSKPTSQLRCSLVKTEGSDEFFIILWDDGNIGTHLRGIISFDQKNI